MKRVLSFIIIALYWQNIIFASGLDIERKILTQQEQIQLHAKKIEYNFEENLIEAKEGVSVAYGDYYFHADNIIYDRNEDLLWAYGNVKVWDSKKRSFGGESIIFKDKLKQAIIEDLKLYVGGNAQFIARKAERIDTNYNYILDAKYTSCKVCKGKSPLWNIKAQKTEVNTDTKRVIYRNAFFEVMGVPLLFLPYFAHPLPNADAQSGLLTPSIKDSDLLVPFYYRIKPNMDVTLATRLKSSSIIYQGEFRHLLPNGPYHAKGSFSRSSDPKKDRADKAITKTKRFNRFHILSAGDFKNDNWNYGFKFQRTSDASYMKNNGYGNYPYLTTSLYGNRVENADYVSVQAMNFQDLTKDFSKTENPYIFPYIRAQKIYQLGGGNTHLTMKGNILHFTKGKIRTSRGSVYGGINNITITTSGSVIDTGVSVRGNVYITKERVSNSQYTENAMLMMPEAYASWKHPMISKVNSNISNIIEPQIKLILAPLRSRKDLKTINVDSGNMQINTQNLFSNNRYFGLDRYEDGTRLSYGINSILQNHKHDFRLSAFLGQIYRFSNNKNIPNHSGMSRQGSDIVGKLGFAANNILDSFYKFRINPRNMKLTRNEVGTIFTRDKTSASLRFAEFHVDPSINAEQSKFSQAMFKVRQKLNSNWVLGASGRVDINRKHSTKMLEQTIKVTYIGDCVTINTKIGHRYTQDEQRNIRKKNSYNISIGLKSISF